MVLLHRVISNKLLQIFLTILITLFSTATLHTVLKLQNNTSKTRTYSFQELCFSDLAKIYKSDFFKKKTTEFTYRGYKYKMVKNGSNEFNFIPINNAPPLNLNTTSTNYCKQERKESLTTTPTISQNNRKIDHFKKSKHYSNKQQNYRSYYNKFIIPISNKVIYCKNEGVNIISEIITNIKEKKKQLTNIETENITCLSECDGKRSYCESIPEDKIQEFTQCLTEAKACLDKCKFAFENKLNLVEKELKNLLTTLTEESRKYCITKK